MNKANNSDSNIKKISLNIVSKTKKLFSHDDFIFENEPEDNNASLEKKLRVETKTWGLNGEDLEHQKQLDTIQQIYEINNSPDTINTPDKLDKKYKTKMLAHIKTKIQSYKQQDILKNRLNKDEFVSLYEVLKLLFHCELKCHYCSDNVFILYEIVRETKQWSLDRINNDIGHNTGNLIIACLECNLKRRRTNKDAFFYTKNLVITREGIDNN